MLSLSGPPEVCSRKGFETGRYWLEDETDTVQIWAGDEPHDASMIAASVLLSNVTEVPRIDAIQERAVAYKREQEGTEAGKSTEEEGPTTETTESDGTATDEASEAATTETSESDGADDAATEVSDDGSTDPSSAANEGSDDGSGEGTVGTEERIPDTD